MKILLVNDDGYKSEGIKVLDRVLTEHGHEVWVCAPESQKSACSHAITLDRAVRIHKVSDRHYSCDGFPADCTLFSILGAIPMGTPDLVISGINMGFNTSSDVVYSATVGGASEAAMKLVPGIALSCETVHRDSVEDGKRPDYRDFENYPFEEAAQFMADHVQQFCQLIVPGTFLNINVPDGACGKWKTASLGRIEFHDVLDLKGEELFKIRGSAFPDISADDVKKTDYYTVFVEKLISVTALTTDYVCNKEIQDKLSSFS